MGGWGVGQGQPEHCLFAVSTLQHRSALPVFVYLFVLYADPQGLDLVAKQPNRACLVALKSGPVWPRTPT